MKSKNPFKKHLFGDVFSNRGDVERELTGLLYRSRTILDAKRSESTGGDGSEQNSHELHSRRSSTVTASTYLESLDGEKYEALETLNPKQQLAITLRNWCMIPENHCHIIEEGAVTALVALTNIDDNLIRECCAAAFYHLSSSPSNLSALLSSGASSGIITLAMQIRSGRVQKLCAMALCNLTMHTEGEVTMAKDGALIAIMILLGNKGHKLLPICVQALYNLTCVNDHYEDIERIFKALINIPETSFDHYPYLVRALVNCARFSWIRLRMIEDGAVQSMSYMLQNLSIRQNRNEFAYYILLSIRFLSESSFCRIELIVRGVFDILSHLLTFCENDVRNQRTLIKSIFNLLIGTTMNNKSFDACVKLVCQLIHKSSDEITLQYSVACVNFFVLENIRHSPLLTLKILESLTKLLKSEHYLTQFYTLEITGHILLHDLCKNFEMIEDLMKTFVVIGKDAKDIQSIRIIASTVSKLVQDQDIQTMLERESLINPLIEIFLDLIDKRVYNRENEIMTNINSHTMASEVKSSIIKSSLSGEDKGGLMSSLTFEEISALPGALPLNVIEAISIAICRVSLLCVEYKSFDNRFKARVTQVILKMLDSNDTSVLVTSIGCARLLGQRGNIFYKEFSSDTFFTKVAAIVFKYKHEEILIKMCCAVLMVFSCDSSDLEASSRMLPRVQSGESVSNTQVASRRIAATSHGTTTSLTADSIMNVIFSITKAEGNDSFMNELIVTIICNMSITEEYCDKFVQNGVIAVLSNLSGTTSEVILELCSKSICNITSWRSLHRQIIKQNILQIILMISLVRSVGTISKQFCVRALLNLITDDDENIVDLCQAGIIRIFATLSNRHDHITRSLCARGFLLFTLTNKRCEELIQQRNILQSLFLLMKSKSSKTKVLVSYAICNLLSNPISQKVAIMSGGLGVLKIISTMHYDDIKVAVSRVIVSLLSVPSLHIHLLHQPVIISLLTMIIQQAFTGYTYDCAIGALTMMSQFEAFRYTIIDKGSILIIVNSILNGIVGSSTLTTITEVCRCLCFLSYTTDRLESFIKQGHVVIALHMLLNNIINYNTTMLASPGVDFIPENELKSTDNVNRVEQVLVRVKLHEEIANTEVKGVEQVLNKDNVSVQLAQGLDTKSDSNHGLAANQSTDEAEQQHKHQHQQDDPHSETSKPVVTERRVSQAEITKAFIHLHQQYETHQHHINIHHETDLHRQSTTHSSKSKRTLNFGSAQSTPVKAHNTVDFIDSSRALNHAFNNVNDFMTSSRQPSGLIKVTESGDSQDSRESSVSVVNKSDHNNNAFESSMSTLGSVGAETMNTVSSPEVIDHSKDYNVTDESSVKSSQSSTSRRPEGLYINTSHSASVKKTNSDQVIENPAVIQSPKHQNESTVSVVSNDNSAGKSSHPSMSPMHLTPKPVKVTRQNSEITKAIGNPANSQTVLYSLASLPDSILNGPCDSSDGVISSKSDLLSLQSGRHSGHLVQTGRSTDTLEDKAIIDSKQLNAFNGDRNAKKEYTSTDLQNTEYKESAKTLTSSDVLMNTQRSLEDSIDGLSIVSNLPNPDQSLLMITIVIRNLSFNASISKYLLHQDVLSILATIVEIAPAIQHITFVSTIITLYNLSLNLDKSLHYELVKQGYISLIHRIVIQIPIINAVNNLLEITPGAATDSLLSISTEPTIFGMPDDIIDSSKIWPSTGSVVSNDSFSKIPKLNHSSSQSIKRYQRNNKSKLSLYRKSSNYTKKSKIQLSTDDLIYMSKSLELISKTEDCCIELVNGGKLTEIINEIYNGLNHISRYYIVSTIANVASMKSCREILVRQGVSYLLMKLSQFKFESGDTGRSQPTTDNKGNSNGKLPDTKTSSGTQPAGPGIYQTSKIEFYYKETQSKCALALGYLSETTTVNPGVVQSMLKLSGSSGLVPGKPVTNTVSNTMDAISASQFAIRLIPVNIKYTNSAGDVLSKTIMRDESILDPVSGNMNTHYILTEVQSLNGHYDSLLYRTESYIFPLEKGGVISKSSVDLNIPDTVNRLPLQSAVQRQSEMFKLPLPVDPLPKDTSSHMIEHAAGLNSVFNTPKHGIMTSPSSPTYNQIIKPSQLTSAAEKLMSTTNSNINAGNGEESATTKAILATSKTSSATQSSDKKQSSQNSSLKYSSMNSRPASRSNSPKSNVKILNTNASPPLKPLKSVLKSEDSKLSSLSGRKS